MDYTEISREECAEALSKIITVLSEIILDQHDYKTSLYPKAQDAFNTISKATLFNKARWASVDFNEAFHQEAAKLFYGISDHTLGLTASFWASGLVSLAGKNTMDAYQTYRQNSLMNSSNLPDDHIAVELAFLGHLLARGKITEAKSFAHNNILNWWPTALKNIEARTQNKDIQNFFLAVNASLIFLEEL